MSVEKEFKQYGKYNVDDYLEAARNFTNGKKYFTRAKIIRQFKNIGITINPKVAAAILYRIGFVRDTCRTYIRE